MRVMHVLVQCYIRNIDGASDYIAKMVVAKSTNRPMGCGFCFIDY